MGLNIFVLHIFFKQWLFNVLRTVSNQDAAVFKSMACLPLSTREVSKKIHFKIKVIILKNYKYFISISLCDVNF